MSWRQFLFSPSGRINRAKYWGALGIQYGLGIAAWMPAIFMFDDKSTSFSDEHPAVAFTYIAAASILTLAMLVSHFFAQVKRFHDRDKPWPWIFIGFIPYIGGIWILVECGILPGTVGRNRFGPDPLGNTNDIVDVFGAPEPQPSAPLVETR